MLIKTLKREVKYTYPCVMIQFIFEIKQAITVAFKFSAANTGTEVNLDLFIKDSINSLYRILANPIIHSYMAVI